MSVATEEECSLADITEAIEIKQTDQEEINNGEEIDSITEVTTVEKRKSKKKENTADSDVASSIDPYEQPTQPDEPFETSLDLATAIYTEKSAQEATTNNNGTTRNDDSDSEFSDSAEDQEISNSIDQDNSEYPHDEDDEESYFDKNATYPRRSSRKRKLLEKKRKERIAKKQKTNEDPMMNDIAVAEDPADLKLKSSLLHKEWKFLVIVHFMEHFRETLEIPEGITVIDLEFALITANKSMLFRDLLVCLLKHLRCSVHTSIITWYRVLNIVLNRRSHCFPDGNPLKDIAEEDFFSQTSLVVKVQILHFICEWILEESEAVAAIIKENRADPLFLRPLPLGWDSQENAYWRFGNSDFVYKEVKIEDDGHWELVCRNVREWKALAAKFEDSEDRDEQEFYSFLVEDLIPPIEERAEEEEKIQKKLGRYHIHSQNIIDTSDRPRRSTRTRTFEYDEDDYEPMEDYYFAYM